MRLFLAIGCALAVATPAQAHLIVKPKDRTLQARVASQERNLAHARYVCTEGSGNPKRWHCAAAYRPGWIARELRETKAAITRQELLSYGGNPNVRLGRQMAATYGWHIGYQWDALYDLWNHESGWDHTQHNTAGSGACGIPQSMTSCFDYDARRQIAWGLAYIKRRYGAPSAALAHLRTHNWY